MIHPIAVLGALLSVVGAEPLAPPWVESTLLSIVNVTAAPPAKAAQKRTRENATGLVVGWSNPTLFIVTANHVMDSPGFSAVLPELQVQLAPTICPDSLPATPRAGDRTLDLAVVSVSLPPECAQRMSRIRRIHGSPLALAATVAAFQQETLYLLGRGPEGGPLSWTVPGSSVSDVDGSFVVARTVILKREASGSPLFSHDGRLVGMAVNHHEAGGTEAADNERAAFLNYGLIQEKLKDAGIPQDFAGSVCDLFFKGYPPGSMFAQGEEAAQPIREPNQVKPGKQRIRVVKDGYEPAEMDEDLPAEGSMTECVTLVGKWDRRFARAQWPLLIGSGLVLAGSAVVGVMAREDHDQFYRAPTQALYDRVKTENRIADVLGLVGLVGAAAFGAGHLFLTPQTESSIKRCSP